MQEFDRRIAAFLTEHHVLTLASSVNDNPWCASLFYVYIAGEHLLAFTSEAHTRHVKDMTENSLVAGTVVLETRRVGVLRGVQFQGCVRKPGGPLAERAKRAYLARFPYALLKPAPLWVVELHTVKFTDNRLGFGKKIYWERE
ncbi:MAG: pyridoxamine 5'-phosphate oxidase family protein [Prevotellaceae bacterium]|nr:pyridoxamine 5'-phosphate oxidase family protein [Prevotellaceae bacterium]